MHHFVLRILAGTGLLVAVVGCHPDESTPPQSTNSPSTPDGEDPRGADQSDRAAVTLTPAAAEMIRQVQAAKGGTYVRVGVTNSGPTGFQYALGMEEESHGDDLVIESEGITLLVDKKSALYLEGSTIDFLEENGQRGFKFDNPNAVAPNPVP
jgi:iron-sulfur cluster assembly protein